MKVTIQPSAIQGTVTAPASKSSMQRACAAALIRKGRSVIHNAGHSEDDQAALGILEKLGARVEKDGDSCIISSPGFPNQKWLETEDAGIDCGESGLSLRMFVPIIALSAKTATISGKGSLVNRPLDTFDTILPPINVAIQKKKEKLPLTVTGPMIAKDITIDGSISSQFLTGLLMAYSAVEARQVSIFVKNLKSKPYIDLTLDVIRQFGLKVPENRHYEEFYFDNSNIVQPGIIEYTVEADWSGGAFLLVAGAIAGPVTVRGLDPLSTQADRAILDALMSANAALAIEAKGIKIRPAPMQAFEFDATDCPDLFPPLAALAAYCSGATRIKGVNRLIFKESNRALALWEEFGKMGIDIEVKDDWMTIHGGQPKKAASVYSHQDHRIAMACAVAALGSGGKTEIERPGAVKKSYPDFYRDLKSLGAAVSLPQAFSL
jgi:3-phosphoshikimate 1-carboxyvinyltransferase